MCVPLGSAGVAGVGGIAAALANRDGRAGRVPAWRRDGGTGRGGSGCSGSTTTNRTGRAMPFSVAERPSRRRSPSTRWTRCATLSVARISPGFANAHSRAARFSAAPRYPPCVGIASPASSPIPTPSGNAGSASVAVRSRRCNSTDARNACLADRNTHNASSPRSSNSSPSNSGTASRTRSANRPASVEAASSPCSCVNRVYPRMSANRNVRMSAPVGCDWPALVS